MAVNPNLERLVDLAAPYWAGEAEVVWTYFQNPGRTKETDLLWLRRQCFKEIWGSGVGDKKKGLFQGPVAYLSAVFNKIDHEVDRHEVLDVIDDLRTEFFHYCLFADVYTDEIGHMRAGFVGLSRQELSPAEWDEIAAMTKRILLQRLHMRNEQFSFPLSAERICAIDAGDIEPLAFDYTGLDSMRKT